MEFCSISIEDKQRISDYLKTEKIGICDHCFTDIYMWQSHYQTKFCIEEDFLYIKTASLETGEDYYMCPIGNGDLKSAILKIEEYAKENSDDFNLVSITDEKKEQIEKLMPNYFDFYENRDLADYVYLAEKLITLSGKKLHSKRNFINRFKTEFEGRWSYEQLNDENYKDAWEFHKKWYKKAGGLEEELSLKAETCAIKKVLDNYKVLDILGGLLRIDGEVVAFTLATKSTDDMFVIQIEKGDVNYPGVYPMINQQFAMHNCNDVIYINREDDLGVEGLRTAKLSYKPEIIRMKYSAKIKA
ncbi:MAG: phosphatidylglycerol lysyltransferase domain-containing protein [Clostridia bacterium]